MKIPDRSSCALTDGRILLRPFLEQDVDALHDGITESIEIMSTWLQWCHSGYTRDEAAAWIGNRSGAWQVGRTFDFAITDQDRFIGACILSRIYESNFANLEYWVRQSCRSQGIAPLAANLVARFGCDMVGFERVVIFAPAQNAASRRVAEKAGAENNGILAGRLLIHGRTHDAAVYSFMPKPPGKG